MLDKRHMVHLQTRLNATYNNIYSNWTHPTTKKVINDITTAVCIYLLSVFIIEYYKISNKMYDQYIYNP